MMGSHWARIVEDPWHTLSAQSYLNFVLCCRLLDKGLLKIMETHVADEFQLNERHILDWNKPQDCLPHL